MYHSLAPPASPAPPWGLGEAYALVSWHKTETSGRISFAPTNVSVPLEGRV